MSIADKLQELINSKADMKSAIAEKGVDVEGGLTTYADAIRKIQQWAGDRFAAIGYNAENTGGFIQLMDADIEVSKKILDEWNSTGSFDMTKWKNIAVYFPAVDLTRYPSYKIFRFLEWSKLQVVPSLDFTGRTSMNGLFYKCNSLKYIGNITGTESVTDMSMLFEDCTSLTSIPYFDTSSVTSMHDMFNGCTSLTTIPQLDTSSATDLNAMFSGCTSLTTIPQLDTSSVTSMHEMFSGCTSLTSIPQLDTSSATDLKAMFWGCSSLTTVPHLDTSSVTDMRFLFAYCSSLTTVPPIVTSNVTEIGYMFTDCESLTSIPLLDCSSITEKISPFQMSSNLYNLTDLGGFKDLKVGWSIDFLNMIPNVTVESLMNVINNLYDLTANGLSGQTLKFGTPNLNKLTDEQIAVAINKGWTLI